MSPVALRVALGAYSLLAAITFLVLRESASTGFEISIYRSTPLLAWVFIAGTLLGGVALLAYQGFTRQWKHWWVGLAAIMVALFVFSALPHLRGYMLYADSDPPMHASYAQGILETGSLAYNGYPLVHMLVTETVQMTGISLLEAMRVVPPVLTATNILLMYLLATAVWKDRRIVLLATAAAATLFASWHQVAVYPRAIGSLMFPLVIYLYLRQSQEGYRLRYHIPLMLLAAAYPFSHQHYALVFPLFIGVMAALPFVARRLAPQREGASPSRPSWRSLGLGLGLLSGVIFFLFISRWDQFDWQLRNIHLIFTGRFMEVSTKTESFLVRLSTLGDIFNFVWRTWGHMLIYGLLTAYAAWLVYRRARAGDPLHHTAFLLLLWGIAGDVYTMFALTYLYYGRGITTGILRYSNLIPLMPIYVGLALFALAELARRLRGWSDVAVTVGATTVIGLAALLALGAVYVSPWVYRTSQHITRDALAATRWAVMRNEARLLVNGLGLHGSYLYLLGPISWSMEETKYAITARSDRIALAARADTIPHFGYHDGDTWGDQRPSGGLTVIVGRFWDTYNDPVMSRAGTVGPHTEGRWDFDPEDFERLPDDPTVIRLYDAGESTVWYTYPPSPLEWAEYVAASGMPARSLGDR